MIMLIILPAPEQHTAPSHGADRQCTDARLLADLPRAATQAARRDGALQKDIHRLLFGQT